MELTVVELTVAIVVLVVAAAMIRGLVWASRRLAANPPPRRGAWEEPSAGDSRIVFDIEVDGPVSEAVERLAADAARRALAADPALTRVLVVDRSGRELLRLRRDQPLPPSVELPPTLHEPHARASRTPSPVRPPTQPDTPGRQVETNVVPRPFADRFSLPDAVRRTLTDPDDPLELVRALLEAAGRPAERDGDVVRTGEVAVTVAPIVGDPEVALTRAYLRVRGAGAARGLVIRLGYVDPALVRRRDRAAPDVRYVDITALQRMADAVAIGADPIRFATGPPTVRS